MAKTLAQILLDVNSVLDLETAAPTGDELDTRTNYANQVVWDVAALGQLEEFRKEYLGLVTGQTVSLPTDFKEFQEDPMLWNGSGWQRYTIIEPEQKYNQDTQDHYAYILGNPQDGHYLILSQLVTNMTLSAIYQKFPIGFPTETAICELSDPQVVVRGVESYVLYARADDRFPTAQARSEKQVQNLMGRSMKGAGGLPKDTKMKFKNPLG